MLLARRANELTLLIPTTLEIAAPEPAGTGALPPATAPARRGSVRRLLVMVCAPAAASVGIQVAPAMAIVPASLTGKCELLDSSTHSVRTMHAGSKSLCTAIGILRPFGHWTCDMLPSPQVVLGTLRRSGGCLYPSRIGPLAHLMQSLLEAAYLPRPRSPEPWCLPLLLLLPEWL